MAKRSRIEPAPAAAGSSVGNDTAADVIALALEKYSNYVGMVWPILSGGRAPFGELERHTLDWAVMPGEGRNNKRFLGCHREWGKSTGITYEVVAMDGTEVTIDRLTMEGLQNDRWPKEERES